MYDQVWIIAGSFRISLVFDLEDPEVLETWWSGVFASFMINKPNIHHCEWLELKI